MVVAAFCNAITSAGNSALWSSDWDNRVGMDGQERGGRGIKFFLFFDKYLELGSDEGEGISDPSGCAVG